MKTLSISSVCLVGALMLGLFAAWGATAPQVITGEQIAGGGCPCSNVRPKTCPDKGDYTCEKEAVQCNTTGDLECSNVNQSGCFPSIKCVGQYNQDCY